MDVSNSLRAEINKYKAEINKYRAEVDHLRNRLETVGDNSTNGSCSWGPGGVRGAYGDGTNTRAWSTDTSAKPTETSGVDERRGSSMSVGAGGGEAYVPRTAQRFGARTHHAEQDWYPEGSYVVPSSRNGRENSESNPEGRLDPWLQLPVGVDFQDQLAHKASSTYSAVATTTNRPTAISAQPSVGGIALSRANTKFGQHIRKPTNQQVYA